MRNHPSNFKYDEQKIESALKLLAKAISTSGHNPKPVVFHSIRVSTQLWEAGAKEDTVIASILHDLLEDSSLDRAEISSQFGDKVLQYVESMTFDDEIADELERAKSSYIKSASIDSEVLLIRAADLIDNSFYYHFVTNEDKRKLLHDKYKLFMEISEGKITNAIVVQELAEAYKDNVAVLVKDPDER